MKKTEYAFMVLAALAVASKILQWPGTSILTILAFAGYAIFSIAHGYVNGKGENSQKTLLSILVGLGVAGCLLGIMLIFMSWSNAHLVLLASSLLTLVCVLGLVFTKAYGWGDFMIRKSLIFGGLALFVFLLPKYTIFELKHLNDPRLVELYIEMKESKSDSANAAFSNYIKETRGK